LLRQTEPRPKLTVRTNRAFIPYLENTDRHLYLYGGAGSGKSWFAVQKICLRTACEANHKFILLRKAAVDLRESVVPLLEETLERLGIIHEFIINKTERNYFHTLSRNQIICRGLDDHRRIKSLEGATGMFLEEATEFSKDDLDQLNLRIRGKKTNYVQYIYSFNPIDERHHLKKILEEEPPNTTVAHFTYQDNAFLDDEYRAILESYKETNPAFYDVYCLGKWGVHEKGNKFLQNFDESIHVAKLSLDERLSVRLSFDFNIDPFAVTVYQKPDAYRVRVIDKIKLTGDIEVVCDLILSNYGEREFIVTGDASGKARTGVVRGKRSYWQVVKQRLKLRDHQIRLRGRNLDLIESRVICNAALRRCDISIDPRCSELISDCSYAAVDEYGILIKDREHNKNDFLDTFRYLLDAEFPDIVMRRKKYERKL